jgi:hypothetical protein
MKKFLLATLALTSINVFASNSLMYCVNTAGHCNASQGYAADAANQNCSGSFSVNNCSCYGRVINKHRFERTASQELKVERVRQTYNELGSNCDRKNGNTSEVTVKGVLNEILAAKR